MRGCIGLLLAVASGVAWAAPPARALTPAEVAAVKAPTREAYVALARQVFDEGFANPADRERAAADVAKRARSPKELLRLASQGAVQVALSQGGGVAALAGAAMHKPDDPVVATTFGVALALVGRKVDALKVQLWAQARAPMMPLVLTNLGTVYADLGNPGLAKMRLLAATTFDKRYCPAWNALAILYANEGDVRRGVAAYLQSLPCATLKAHKRKLRDARIKERSGGLVDDLGGGAAGGDGDIAFRAFPGWGSVEVFVAETDRIALWQRELKQLWEAADRDMKPEGPVMAFERRRRLNRVRRGTVVLDPGDHASWALDDLAATHGRRLDRLSKEHDRTVAAIDERMSNAIAASAQTFGRGSVAQVREKHNAHCKLARSAVATAFAAWRDAERRHYDQVARNLREYWRATRFWLGQFTDEGERGFHQGRVENFIWPRLSVFPQTYSTRALMYVTQLTSPVGACGKGDVPPQAPAATGTDRRPRKVKSTCPVPTGTGVTMDAGDCSMALQGCEQVNAECKRSIGGGPFGAKAGAGYNFQSRELTLSGGAYFDPAAKIGPATGSINFSSTIDFVFRDGNLQRVTWTVAPGASVGATAGGVGGSVTPPLKEFGEAVVFTLTPVPDEKPAPAGPLPPFDPKRK